MLQFYTFWFSDVSGGYKIGALTRNGLSTSNNKQPTFTCSYLTIETLEQGEKYVQSLQ